MIIPLRYMSKRIIEIAKDLKGLFLENKMTVKRQKKRLLLDLVSLKIVIL